MAPIDGIPMRWIIALALLLLPTASLAQALAPQSRTPLEPLTHGPAWSLKSSPISATLIQTSRDNGVSVLRRTLQCTYGEGPIIGRTFQQAGQPAPRGALRCGRLCQLSLKNAGVDGVRTPESYTEARLTMKAARRAIAEDIRSQREADPWREISDAPFDLLGRMAATCRLPPPVLLQNSHWKGFDQQLIIRSPATPLGFPYFYAVQSGSREYQILTKPLSAARIPAPLVLRVSGRVDKGGVAVALRSQDGRAISPEAAITAGDGAKDLYFNLDSGMAGAALAIRNNDPRARAETFQLTDLEVLPRALLDADDRIDLAAALRDQARGPFNLTVPALRADAAETDRSAKPASPPEAPAAAPDVPSPFLGVASKAPIPQTNVNQCRAACGSAWMTSDHQCTPPPDVFQPPSALNCHRRTNKAYAACLAACGPDPSGATDPAAAAKAPATAKPAKAKRH
jgi:hypothetical protein